MKLGFAPEDEAFRQEVRAFVRTEVPDDLRERARLGLRLDRPDLVRWFNILYRKGWITPAWPKEHGGTGWTPLQRHIYDEEMLLGGAPRMVSSGILMLGPVLLAFGTEEQKAKYLPGVRASETFWAQGFSEPNAGSDLATLRTSARRDENGDFIVSGHKIWTSYAQYCEMMFLLVRTDSECKPQEGISFLLLDMKSPGVTVRPIRMIDGGDDLNEVFLDEVRVPKENLVGEINKGWTYAKYLLGFERTGIAGIGASKTQLARARDIASRTEGPNGPLLQDPHFIQRLAELEIELLALEATALRMLTENPGKGPGVEASILKVRGTEIRQAITALLLDLAGPDALPFVEEALHLEHFAEGIGPDWSRAIAANYLDARKASIYGGANEIQRNVLAKAVLGL